MPADVLGMPVNWCGNEKGAVCGEVTRVVGHCVVVAYAISESEAGC